MTKYCIVILTAIFMSACAGAQDSSLRCDLAGLMAIRRTPVRDLILREDYCAIAAAGTSKDHQYIPYLIKIEKSNREHSGDYHRNAAERAQMALAKLGVQQDLFEIECEIQPLATKYVRVYAVKDKLPYVGGWFAIHLAQDMLLDNQQNHEYLFYGNNGEKDWYPQKIAITMLPNLLGPSLYPEPHERFGIADPSSEKFKGLTEEQVIDGWYHWILNHENELEKLEPTGELVDYSGTRCEEYLKSQGALVQERLVKP